MQSAKKYAATRVRIEAWRERAKREKEEELEFLFAAQAYWGADIPIENFGPNPDPVGRPKKSRYPYTVNKKRNSSTDETK